MIVTLNKPSLIHLPELKNQTVKLLKSGANEITAEEFKQHLTNPTIKQMVEDSIITFDETDLGKKDEPMGEGHLLTLKVKEAVDLVGQTIDGDLLTMWTAKETRKPVQKALDEQLKKLAEPAKLRSEGSSEELDGEKAE